MLYHVCTRCVVPCTRTYHDQQGCRIRKLPDIPFTPAVFAVSNQHLCCTAHEKNLILPKAPTTKRPEVESYRPPFFCFFYKDFSFFCFFAPTPNVSIEAKFRRADMSSLVYSRDCAKATALFVSSFGADLVAEVRKCGSRPLSFRFFEL